MQLVVFDLDGTLVDSEKYFLQSLEYAVKPFNIAADHGLIEKIRSEPPGQLFSKILEPGQGQIAMERLAFSVRELISNISPFDGVMDMLSDLNGRKANLAIWTGRDKDSAQQILEQTGLDSFFSGFRSGSCVSKNKPSDVGLRELAVENRVPFEKTLMVGDHTHDIQPGKGLGCKTAHVRWKADPHDLSPGVFADETFHCLPTFHKWVLSRV